MKIIEPSAKLVRGYEDKPEELIELCGRICYDSQDKIAPGTAQKFCERLKRSGEIEIIKPSDGSVSAESLLDTLGDVNEAYNDALEVGISPQTARCVLPTCLATRLYMTMTLERWRDFLKLRTARPLTRI
ncbi:MAG TPA: hypothetical protein DIV52_02640 [Ruminococcaceae bacterium]|jgi:thymidylate synthase ThyX|nr:hypothetical protein [Oscillospiraceae bacterium]